MFSMLISSKLYSNSLLAALNSRSHLYAGTFDAVSTNMHDLPTLFDDEYPESAIAMNQPIPVAVERKKAQHNPTRPSLCQEEHRESVNSSQVSNPFASMITPYDLGDSDPGSTFIPSKAHVQEITSHPGTANANDIPDRSHHSLASEGASIGQSTEASSLNIGNVVAEVRRLRVQIHALETQRIRENLPPPSYHEEDFMV